MMIAFGIAAAYLGLAALFYIALTRTATDVAAPASVRRPKWLRPRRLRGTNLLRRLRPLLALRLPRRK